MNSLFEKSLNETLESFTYDYDNNFYYNPLTTKLIIRNLYRNKSTLLTGPTGCGKTELIINICKKLNIPYVIYDMGSMLDPLSQLLGTHRIIDGNSVFDASKFTEDVQKPGVIILDELSRATPLANNILMPCLDIRRELPVELADSKSERRIKINDNCIFVATANIGHDYIGTEILDAAIMNRFMTIHIEEMYPEVENNILMSRTYISLDDAKTITDIAFKLRMEYNKGEISKHISLRDTLNAAELIADGFNMQDALTYAFISKFDGMESDMNSEKYKVKSKFLGY